MSSSLKIKVDLVEICQRQLQLKLQRIKSKIVDLHEALSSETKSSAGDKHETNRAMIQLEREKVGYQLADIEQNLKTIKRINTAKRHKKVGFGSVVFTTQFNYFIGVNCRQISTNGLDFYAISTGSPIAKQLLSKEEQDCIEFRSEKIRILKIL